MIKSGATATVLVDASGRITDNAFDMDEPDKLQEQNYVSVWDDHIDFDDKRHRYYIDAAPCHCSTTGFIHSTDFFEGFDADTAIDKMWAGRNWNVDHPLWGQTREEIKATWEANKLRSSALGTRMHELIEWFYNDLISEHELQVHADVAGMPELHQFLNYHRNVVRKRGWIPFRTELRVILEHRVDGVVKQRVPGSIDMLYRDQQGRLIQVDWKRSKQIKRSNRWQRGKGPLAHFDDCNFVHYALQQNIYAMALEQGIGERPAEIYLCICHPNQPDYQLLQLPWLIDEVHAMLKHAEHSKSAEEGETNEKIDV